MLLRLHKLSKYLQSKHIPVLPRLLKAVIYFVFNCVLPPEYTIGSGTIFWHCGLGVVIHPNTTIGRNVNIYNHVVIGGGHDSPDGPNFKIFIGDNVNIGAGAKILCKNDCLSIGNSACIGANAVVLSDVPDYAVVAGVPAKIIKYKAIDRK